MHGPTCIFRASLTPFSLAQNMRDGLFSIVAREPDGALTKAYLQKWAEAGRTDDDGNYNTVDQYGYHAHDAVVAFAVAAHRMQYGPFGRLGNGPFPIPCTSLMLV